MEIRYIRKLTTSHMVIEQTQLPSEWETKMIANASLKNVLFAECICEDGKSTLWYDITAKQSLDVLLEEEGLNYELLCAVLMGIYEAVEEIEGLLLKAECLVLMPESIFVDYEGRQVYLCYCPGNTGLINELFVQLMEYFLTVLNHEDVKAVDLAYEIYGQATKGGWSLRDIKSQVCLSYQKEEDVEEPAQEAYGETESYTASENIEDEIPLTQKASVQNWLEQCIRKIKEKLYQMRKLPKGAKKYEEETERFVLQPEAEEEEPVSRPTVLLAELPKTPEGVLRYEGNGACRDISLEKNECLIGSDKTCQGYIPSETVSRKHARITQVDGIYFLEDLNSSNGTYVGGELLNYKTKISLHKNEVVVFADEKFRFI